MFVADGFFHADLHPGNVFFGRDGFTDGPLTGAYVYGVDVDATAGPISRADVAEFLLQTAVTGSYVR